MEIKQVKLEAWPFEKGKKAKLIWIGEPFKYNNKWMIDTYFNDGNITEKVIQDWANIHFLSIDKYYKDGNLKSAEIIDDTGVMEIIDINLSNITPKYNESEWRIKGSNYKSKSRTLNFYKNNKLYTIPIVEIVRSVLAPNSFMLNTILYKDLFEDYFTYEVDNKALNLYFNSNYKRAYLKDSYYNHLAWIIGNENILKMVSSIGYNISTQNKVLFDFNMNYFKFTARVRRNKTGYTVLEIIKVKGKYIKFNELKIHHPSFEEQQDSNKAKLRTYTRLSGEDDRIIENNADGATSLDESIKEELITHEYLRLPRVRRKKSGYRVKRTKEDEDTKKFIIEDDKERTLADEGGFNRVNGLEISNLDVTKVNGELREFIEVLDILRDMEGIRSVAINIVELPLGRKFSYLEDGITRRRCLIATIIKDNGKEYKVVEVERQEKSLSTLILYRKNYQYNWAYALKLIFNGLITESGKWSNKVFDLLATQNIVVERYKHINKNSYKKALDILNKLKDIT